MILKEPRNKLYTIDGIKNDILDVSLITGSSIGILAYLISMYNWYMNGFNPAYIINFFIITGFTAVMIYRKRLSLNIKTYAVLILLLFFTFSDVIIYGIFSAAKIYMVLIPFFCILFLTFRASVIIYFFAIIFFVICGLLHHKGILIMPYEPQSYVLRLYPWIIGGIHILLVGAILLMVTRRFILTYSSIINNQELIIKERTEDLLSTNEELQASTEELENQKAELEQTLLVLKETQNHLVDSEKMASLGILASGVAHEINNPLNFINGGINALENYIHEHLQDHSKELTPLIGDMQTGVIRAAEIVTSLNYYSRQDAAPKEKCDVHAIIDSCLIMLNHRLKGKVEVIRKYTDESFSLLAHESKLHQVFLNILTNAEQAIEKNGIIEIETKVSNNGFQVLISDNGHGISDADLLKITDPFFTTKEPGKGTGLGLSITRAILQSYHAVMQFSSKPGEGTRVRIQFPLNQKD